MRWYNFIIFILYIFSLTSHSTQYRSFRIQEALNSDVHLPFSNGGQRHNNPLTRIASVYNGPRYSGGSQSSRRLI